VLFRSVADLDDEVSRAEGGEEVGADADLMRDLGEEESEDHDGDRCEEREQIQSSIVAAR
jgi:hypothetical protein